MEAADSEGRMLDEYWSFDDQTMEFRHDFIQWMFPLDEASSFNPNAPVLTAEDRAAFAQEASLQRAVRRSHDRFLAFLGLEAKPDGVVGRSAAFEPHLYIWTRPNHNWLRVTRFLRSLRLLGLEQEAKAVWAFVLKLHQENGYVSESTFTYWKDAVERPT
jgi:hypothetical protein